jgi:hypothetical protein
MKSDETLEHLLELVQFYRTKIQEGTLTGSEGSNFIRALMLLGLRDATIRTRHLEQMSNDPEILRLPFDARGEKILR